MKKFISVLLTMLVILSSTANISFAASGFISSQPTVESVEVLDDYPISRMELDYDGFLQFAATKDDKYWLSLSYFPYTFKITLSDGTVIEHNDCYDYNSIVIDDDTVLLIEAYVTGDKLYEAFKNKKDTVEFNVDCVTYNPNFSIFVDTDDLTNNKTGKRFTFQKKYVDAYVKSITPVTTLDSSIFKDPDYFNLAGEKFKVKYYDGTSKTYTVVNNGINSDTRKPQYTLNGIEIYSWVYDNEVTISYLEAEYVHKVSVKANPYKSLKITDYKFDDEAGLTSITFEATGKKTRTYTVDLTGYQDTRYADGYIPNTKIAALYGYYVYLTDATAFVTEDTQPENITASISMGNIWSATYIYDTVDIKNPKAGEPINSGIFQIIINAVKAIIEKIMNLFVMPL